MASMTADEVLRLVAQGGAVDLSGKDLSGIHLLGASLKTVRFRQANLSRVNLFEADLTDCDLSDTVLDGARYDRQTRWPAGFDPVAAGAKLE